ncbi:hypothetical protein [Ornithinimicrobium kibberense]|uniref:hypothetical protein n=1 Tax=Ornithinimicrobium kibberense TaxID=282060 RepID=UPI003610B269
MPPGEQGHEESGDGLVLADHGAGDLGPDRLQRRPGVVGRRALTGGVRVPGRVGRGGRGSHAGVPSSRERSCRATSTRVASSGAVGSASSRWTTVGGRPTAVETASTSSAVPTVAGRPSRRARRCRAPSCSARRACSRSRAWR